MLIFKEQLPIDTMDIVEVSLPFETEEQAVNAVMHLDVQYGIPCMWYQADARHASSKHKFIIVAIGTGHHWERHVTKDNYIGTLLTGGGSLVLHYFLLKKTELQDKT